MHRQAADASAVSYLALTMWALVERFHRVNWSRNLVGLAYVISTAVHLAPGAAPLRTSGGYAIGPGLLDWDAGR
jgi:hypothetical protein